MSTRSGRGPEGTPPVGSAAPRAPDREEDRATVDDDAGTLRVRSLSAASFLERHRHGIGATVPMTNPSMYLSMNMPTKFTTLSCRAPGERFDISNSAGSKTGMTARRGLKGAHGGS